MLKLAISDKVGKNTFVSLCNTNGQEEVLSNMHVTNTGYVLWCSCNTVLNPKFSYWLFLPELCRIAQTVARLTQEPDVPGSIPGPAIYIVL